MDNFIYGLQAVGHSIPLTLAIIVRNQLIWGFSLGFFVSTVIHVLIIANNPRQITAILTTNPAQSFHVLTPRQADGTYKMSYANFLKEHNRIRSALYIAIFVFIFVIILAMFKY